MNYCNIFNSTFRECLLQNSNEDVRATLQRVVPGLKDFSFSGPKRPVEYEVRVVQVVATTTSATSTSASTSVTPSTTVTAASTTTASSTSVVASGGTAPSTTSKVQYVYKQGGQTVLIDYPMNEEAFSKLKTTTSTLVVKPPSQQPQQVMISTPKVLMSSSVDTLANSLISQITAPVNVPAASGSTTGKFIYQ